MMGLSQIIISQNSDLSSPFTYVSLKKEKEGTETLNLYSDVKGANYNLYNHSFFFTDARDLKILLGMKVSKSK